MFGKELKKGSTEVLVLSAIEERPRHGYEIGRLIERESDGAFKLNASSLYPILYRLEKKGLVRGDWETKGEGRRRRVYRLTAQGKKALARERHNFRAFIRALEKAARIRHA